MPMSEMSFIIVPFHSQGRVNKHTVADSGRGFNLLVLAGAAVFENLFKHNTFGLKMALVGRLAHGNKMSAAGRGDSCTTSQVSFLLL